MPAPATQLLAPGLAYLSLVNGAVSVTSSGGWTFELMAGSSELTSVTVR